MPSTFTMCLHASGEYVKQKGEQRRERVSVSACTCGHERLAAGSTKRQETVVSRMQNQKVNAIPNAIRAMGNRHSPRLASQRRQRKELRTKGKDFFSCVVRKLFPLSCIFGRRKCPDFAIPIAVVLVI